MKNKEEFLEELYKKYVKKHTCIKENCKNEKYTSKKGNLIKVCKEHLDWYYDDKNKKSPNAIKKEIDRQEQAYYDYLWDVYYGDY